MTRRNDLFYAVLLIAAFCVFAIDDADTFFGYLAALPLATLALGLALRVPALFLTGTTTAALAAVATYLTFTAPLGREGGLAWLGLLFAAPGMLLGCVATAWLLKYRIRASLPWIVASLGLAGASLGFLLGQLVVCNTLMQCGALSLV